MVPIAEAPAPRRAFLEFLAVELAPREGRLLAVGHIATACMLTVAIAMVFQIPEPTYMAYIVFVISKDERSATVKTGVGGQIAVTLAVLSTLGLMLFDLAEPALRLPMMALSTFLAMYSVRTFALGPITYLAGFVIVVLQSVVDHVPSPEALTHVVLWIWVVLLVPITLTILLNLLFGPSEVLLRRRTVSKVLGELQAGLAVRDVRRRLSQCREILVSVVARQPQAGLDSATVSKAALHRLSDILVLFEAFPGDSPADVWAALAQRVEGCRAIVEAPDKLSQTRISAALVEAGGTLNTTEPAGLALHAALTSLQQELASPAAAAANPTAGGAKTPPPKRSLLAPDALTNSSHWQFAFKTMLAVMVVYFIYTMLDWPGLRTSIVTCFFVALGSLGETIHKLLLRISGALIGGLIAGLCIVFVLPHMTDIGQLCLLIGVVSAGAAWVATSSELLSYGGLQIAFAFFLGILQDYAPANDLTVLRDRLVGILLGNVVMTLVFTLLWPQSATSGLRAALADALRGLGSLLRRPADAPTVRIGVAQALGRARHFEVVRAFELSMLSTHPTPKQTARVSDIDRLAGTVFVATSAATTTPLDLKPLSSLAPWFEATAANIPTDQPLPSLATAVTAGTEPISAAARVATINLITEMDHVARSIV